MTAACFFTLSARKVYITRHGQVDPKVRVSQKLRELPLTELGEKQAQALANHLTKKCHFKGKIYVSPFYRTIQTGVFTAELLKTKVILEPGIQEVAAGPRPSYCMSSKVIKEQFPALTVPGKRFQDPWRLFNENGAKRKARVFKALQQILAEEKGDILLVGHGGTIGPMVNFFNRKRLSEKVPPVKGYSWNCALYVFELNEKDQVTGGKYTTEFMADKDLTSNFRAPKIPRPDDPRYETKNKKGAGKK